MKIAIMVPIAKERMICFFVMGCCLSCREEVQAVYRYV